MLENVYKSDIVLDEEKQSTVLQEETVYESLVVVESPKASNGQVMYVYFAYAKNGQRGIAMFSEEDFNIIDGIVNINPLSGRFLPFPAQDGSEEGKLLTLVNGKWVASDEGLSEVLAKFDNYYDKDVIDSKLENLDNYVTDDELKVVNDDLKKLINRVNELHPYVNVSISSLSWGTTTYEKGQKVSSNTVNWKITPSENLASATLTYNESTSDVTNVSSKSVTFNPAITHTSNPNYIVRLAITGKNNEPASANISTSAFKFCNRIYYGIGGESLTTLSGLSKTSPTNSLYSSFTCTPTTDKSYVWYCIAEDEFPTKVPQFAVNVDLWGTFNEYSLQYTNSEEYKTTFRCFRSPNPLSGGGTLNIKVK